MKPRPIIPAAPPVPPIISGGYTLTTLYCLPAYQQRERFEAYRQSRSRAPYFHDPRYGENLTSERGLLIDVADLDGYERAFLAGAGIDPVEGVRIPWHEDGARRRPAQQAQQEQD